MLDGEQSSASAVKRLQKVLDGMTSREEARNGRHSEECATAGDAITLQDWTDRCGPFKRRRRLGDVDGIVIHRSSIGVDAEDTANQLRRLRSVGSMAYHFLVMDDGTVQQAAPLDIITPHARSYNARNLAVAIHGDFTKHEPTDEQWWAAVFLCNTLMTLFCMNPGDLDGHTSLPSATADPRKRCPGDLWPMEAFRTCCGLSIYPQLALEETALGIVLDSSSVA